MRARDALARPQKVRRVLSRHVQSYITNVHRSIDRSGRFLTDLRSPVDSSGARVINILQSYTVRGWRARVRPPHARSWRPLFNAIFCYQLSRIVVARAPEPAALREDLRDFADAPPQRQYRTSNCYI